MPWIGAWMARASREPHLAALVLVVGAALGHGLLAWTLRLAGGWIGSGRASQRRLRSLRRLLAPLAVLGWVQVFRLAVFWTRDLWTRDLPGWGRAADWVHAVGTIGALWWLLSRLADTVAASLPRAGERDTTWHADARRLLRRALPLVAVLAARALLQRLEVAPSSLLDSLTTVAATLVIVSVARQAIDSTARAVLRQHPVDVPDNLQARAVHTQVAVARTIALVLLGILGTAAMLMAFDGVRQLGAGLLASAGLAGIIVGVAAQRTLATLLAGLQLALTQPIRVDDVVVINGQFGNVEEITLTYVVVRIWDLRRLVVPVTTFIEGPFENWTRTSTDLLSAVTFHVDSVAVVPDLRRELTAALAASSLWDGKVNVLQVTEVHAQSLEVRALMSATNPGRSWDLRCEVRERLLRFLEEHQARPRLRLASSPAPDQAIPGLDQPITR